MERGDLFNLPLNEFVLAHCISADFALGAGIALEFDKIFNMRSKLHEQYSSNGEIGKALKVGNVYNLVTKVLYWHKPTYQDIEDSLVDLRDQMIENKETKLGMPLIACDLDGKRWVRIRFMIEEVFKDTDIDITVKYLNKKLL